RQHPRGAHAHGADALAVPDLRVGQAPRPLGAGGGDRGHRRGQGPLMAGGPVPLLAASEARIAVDGVTAIDRLTLATEGDHVLVAGDTRALFAAITGVPLADPAAPEGDDGALPGEAFVVAGTLSVAGHSVAERAHLATIGAAPLDPPLPP